MAISPQLLEGFESISLEEMGKVKLMNRVDSKFVTTFDKILALLNATKEGYLIQAIGSQRNMPYQTLYFDTGEGDMFYQHVRGKKTRQKVRTRIYEGSETPPFLEIKHKNNKGRTKKKRVALDSGDSILDHSDFIGENSFYECSSLTPCIENHFYRITLVDKCLTERITIDTDLKFHNLKTGEIIGLPGIGIIEWKRDGISEKSELLKILRQLRIKESGFSKYCIGLALTDPSLKQNRLKAKLRLIQKLLSPNVSHLPTNKQYYTNLNQFYKKSGEQGDSAGGEITTNNR